jgi:predicted outer membrane protein
MIATRRNVLALVPLAAAGLGLAACARSVATAKPGATATPADVAFITNAYDVIHFDNEVCMIADAHATNPKVKALAARILQETESFRIKIGPIAQADGIQPPQALRNDLRVRLVHARLQNGVDFDQTFLADEIASHQEALQLSEMMMNDASGDPRLQAFAREGQDLLKQSLRVLTALQKQVGMSGG